METVCGGKSGSVVVVMGTSVLEVSDSSYGEELLWDCSLVTYLCLALHLPVGASCRNIRGVDRQAEVDIQQSFEQNCYGAEESQGLSVRAFKYCIFLIKHFLDVTMLSDDF